MPRLNSLKKHKILLDTHVFLWSMVGSSKLSKSFSSVFDRILKNQGILISPMSLWEIGMLVEKKRIELDMDVLDWVYQALDTPGMHLCSMTPRILIQSTRLVGTFEGDSVDRLLITRAYEENAVLVTCDKKILKFGEGNFINVFDPSK